MDVSGDEDDGFDETIYPVDFQDYEGETGQIIDDVSLAMKKKRGGSLIGIFVWL